jgi:putative acetyltransferase
MNTPNVVIRSFKPSDTEEIINLFRQTVHTIGARYYSQEQVNAWAPLSETPLEREAYCEKWQKKLESNITLVAELNGVIVGFADMTRDGHLDHMYVHKDYQGCGASYALIKNIERKARELGITKITTHASSMAMPLAKRIGYTVIKKQTVVRQGVELTNYVMEKVL